MKIDRIEVFPLCYRWQGYWKFLEGSPGHTVLAVKITADNGLVGWGMSLPVPKWSYESQETAWIAIAKYYAPALVGREVEDLDGAHRAMDAALCPSFSTGMPLARAGIDIALHDLVGKQSGRSLADMWGLPPGGPVCLSWTVSVRTLDEVEGEVEAGRRRGYRNFNIKISPNVAFDVELARAVRKAAPQAFLWADANGGYDLAAALEVAPQLADAGVDIFEAPLRPHYIDGYQRLKQQGALPITMDEGLVSPVEVEEFIRLGMVDGVTLKLSRSGGLLSAKQQIKRVLDAGLFWLGSGLTDPDVSLAATLGLYSAHGLARPAALNGPQFLRDDILATPLRIEGDLAYPPAGPGLGVTVDETKLAALLRPVTWPAMPALC
jgi:L-alanine-DL-glutamate epimerase-like enolase superfamily enzyme